MSQKFQASIEQQDSISFVKLVGVIDEDNELTELTDKIDGGTIVIDLSEVERINSCGVRDWVNWLSTVEGKPSDVVLVECAPAIVAQINLVNNFTGNGIVKSFYVPYFCPECDQEKVLLCESLDIGGAPHEPPTCRCDECDLVMEFDDMADSYFAFLSSAGQQEGREKLDQLLGSEGSASDDRAKIRARVGSGNLSGQQMGSGPSLPSVPSLPTMSKAGSRPGVGGTLSGVEDPTSVTSVEELAAVGPKAGVLVYGLFVVLLAAIGVLGYLILATK